MLHVTQHQFQKLLVLLPFMLSHLPAFPPFTFPAHITDFIYYAIKFINRQKEPKP